MMNLEKAMFLFQIGSIRSKWKVSSEELKRVSIPDWFD